MTPKCPDCRRDQDACICVDPIEELEAENARLRAALSVICNASQAARFDDLRQVAYEALTALKGQP